MHRLNVMHEVIHVSSNTTLLGGLLCQHRIALSSRRINPHLEPRPRESDARHNHGDRIGDNARPRGGIGTDGWEVSSVQCVQYAEF